MFFKASPTDAERKVQTRANATNYLGVEPQHAKAASIEYVARDVAYRIWQKGEKIQLPSLEAAGVLEEWTVLEGIHSHLTSARFVVLKRETEGETHYIVTAAGTRMPEYTSIINNFNKCSGYTLANIYREPIAQIIKADLKKRAVAKPVRMVVTGHSQGGAIAQQLLQRLHKLVEVHGGASLDQRSWLGDLAQWVFGEDTGSQGLSRHSVDLVTWSSPGITEDIEFQATKAIAQSSVPVSVIHNLVKGDPVTKFGRALIGCSAHGNLKATYQPFRMAEGSLKDTHSKPVYPALNAGTTVLPATVVDTTDEKPKQLFLHAARINLACERLSEKWQSYFGKESSKPSSDVKERNCAYLEQVAGFLSDSSPQKQAQLLQQLAAEGESPTGLIGKVNHLSEESTPRDFMEVMSELLAEAKDLSAALDAHTKQRWKFEIGKKETPWYMLSRMPLNALMDCSMYCLYHIFNPSSPAIHRLIASLITTGLYWGINTVPLATLTFGYGICYAIGLCGLVINSGQFFDWSYTLNHVVTKNVESLEHLSHCVGVTIEESKRYEPTPSLENGLVVNTLGWLFRPTGMDMLMRASHSTEGAQQLAIQHALNRAVTLT